MNPNAVSSLEIWHLGNGQGHSGALDAHLDLGAYQVEGGIIGWRDRGQQEAQQNRSHSRVAEQFYKFREAH
jgi:hypothetical protein